MTDVLASLFSLHLVEGWLEAGSYLMLFGLLFACGLGLPLPEDIPLIITGALLAKGTMTNWPLACAAAWCGIIGGDVLLYHFGKKFGLNITKVPFVGKHVTRARIEHAEHLFERYGIWVVAIGRLFAGVRGAMVVAAGTIRYSFLKFIIADGLAALVSGGLFIALGYFVGHNLDALRARIQKWEHAILWIAIPIVLCIVLFIWWRKRRRAPLADIALEKADEVASHHPAKSKSKDWSP